MLNNELNKEFIVNKIKQNFGEEKAMLIEANYPIKKVLEMSNEEVLLEINKIY